jgi:hypothetical protein
LLSRINTLSPMTISFFRRLSSLYAYFFIGLQNNRYGKPAFIITCCCGYGRARRILVPDGFFLNKTLVTMKVPCK